ncbi:MAG: helix-turn-helix transcriptional regulator [Desulfobacteraceae bacterium]|nr:helix-turn-helix transcriptional regulator [Desulfobacteraceae bacterium]
MQARTKKRLIETGLVPLHFMVHPANVERIKRYVAAVEPDEEDEGTMTAEEFFAKHFTGQTEGAVVLRGARHRENLTQAQLAELTGIPQRHISEMENGKRTIGKERAKLLSKALNTDYRVFL